MPFVATSLRLPAVRALALAGATAGAVWLFVERAQPGSLWHSLSGLPVRAAATAVVATLAGVALGAVRWRGLLAAGGVEAATSRLFAALATGAAVNNVVPARGGDALRVEAVRRQTGASRVATAGTLLAERMLDGLILALLVFLGAVLTGAGRSFVLLGSGIGVAAALGAVAAPRVGRRLRGRLEPLAAGVAVFRSVRALGPALVLSAGIWLADVVMYGALAHGFGIGASLGALLLLVGAGNLALAVPGAAAGLGTFELVTLAGAHGIGVHGASLAAFVVAVHAVIVLPPTVLGALTARAALPRSVAAAQ
jgi:glycosyltransferase 2 family protein